MSHRPRKRKGKHQKIRGHQIRQVIYDDPANAEPDPAEVKMTPLALTIRRLFWLKERGLENL